MAAQEHKGVRFAKYLYSGYPVWSDRDRLEILARASRSSHTVTAADFTSIGPTTDQKAAVEIAFPGGRWEGLWYIHERIRVELVRRLLQQLENP